MDRTVVGLFDDVNDAQRAVEQLLSSGFNRNDISVVRTNEQAETWTGATSDSDAPETSATATGTGVGAVLGGIAGLVVGLGALAIPGIGPIVAAGPLASVLAGAGVGAATGGVIGVLADAGLSKDEAEYYSEGIRRGGTLVTVRTGENEYARATEILTRFSAVDVDQRATEPQPAGAGLTGAETNQTPYTNVYAREFEDYEDDFRKDCAARHGDTDDSYERYRPAYRYGWRAHKLFTGRDWSTIEPDLRTDWLHRRPNDDWDDLRGAVQTGWDRYKAAPAGAGRGAALGFDRTTAEMSQSFDDYDPDFRNDWETTYGRSGYRYERYRPAYQYGYTLATETRSRGRTWNEIEAEARRDWERQHPSDAWTDFKDAVRNAWESVRADGRDA